MDSCLGYEAISRKKKVAFFSLIKEKSIKENFGWPAPMKKKYNFFLAKKLNYNEIKRVLDNIYSCSQVNWEKKYFKILRDLMYIDH